jgi:hypothetical protein
MAVTDDIAVPIKVDAGAADDAARALFEEARRRRRRRYVVSAVSVLTLVGLVVGTLVAIGAGSTTPAARKTTAEHGAAGPRIRSLTFAGSFAPEQVVSEGGKIWLIGSTGSSADPSCAIEEVDPVRLRTETFPIPACGSYVAVGEGRIFLADGAFTGATDVTAFHIESFDTVTGTAVVMGPVDISVTGTGYAHMAMTFAAGSLWLNPWSTEVLEISPSTGAVVRTVTGMPISGGGHPLIVGGGSGLWLAGGVASPATIYRLDPGSGTPVVFATGPSKSSILWLSAVGDRLWAEVGTDEDGGRTVVTRMEAFTPSGRKVVETSPENVGDLPAVGTGGQLWSSGVGARCNGPQRLWRIDSQTGRTVVTATLRSPVAPCLFEGDGSELAAAGQSVFVLDPTGDPAAGGVLYRIRS